MHRDFGKDLSKSEMENVSLKAQILSSNTKKLSLMANLECEFRTLRLRMDELMSSAP